MMGKFEREKAGDHIKSDLSRQLSILPTNKHAISTDNYSSNATDIQTVIETRF